jgi:geranylgeranyl diphosphate synthase type I
MERDFFVMPNAALQADIQHNLVLFASEWQQEETIGSRQPIDAFCDLLLRGGKRLRGTLAMQSYYAHGGTDGRVALGAARIFEIIQTSLLIVDDIADRSEWRRGGASVHRHIRAYAEAQHMKGSAQHYGVAQAMNVAYAGLHKATTELLQLPVSDAIARGACARFHDNILVTINGQIDDMYNEMTHDLLTEQDIERVLIRKSAYYTILSPIELGASLAGVTTVSDNVRQYAVHAGCAFQIADDIISTFGEEGETGKGKNDDIREGKMTLLTHYAFAQATPKQKQLLGRVLGNEHATPSGCDAVRGVILATGAREYAAERLVQHKAAAIEVLAGDRDTNHRFVAYLGQLIDYLVNRRA